MRRARLLVAMLLIGCSGSAPDDGAPGPEDMDQPTDVATSADSAVSQEDTPAAEDTEPEQDAGAGEDVPAPECPASTSAQAGVVATTRGAVGGTAESGGWTFLGVPYARPPIGELRFRPPQQPECWDDILPAKELAPKCPQLDGKVAPEALEEALPYVLATIAESATVRLVQLVNTSEAARARAGSEDSIRDIVLLGLLGTSLFSLIGWMAIVTIRGYLSSRRRLLEDGEEWSAEVDRIHPAGGLWSLALLVFILVSAIVVLLFVLQTM